MQRNALVLDETDFFHHHGVRHYAVAFFNEARQAQSLDLLIRRKDNVYKVSIDPTLKSPLCDSLDRIVDLRKKESMLVKLAKEESREMRSRRIILDDLCSKGSHIHILDLPYIYQKCVFSAPWCFHKDFIDVDNYYVICHDCIPCQYYLRHITDATSDRNFSAIHSVVYRSLAKRDAGRLLLTNQTLRKPMGDFYGQQDVEQSPHIALSILAGKSSVACREPRSRKNRTIILSAPFDQRKSPWLILDILNGLSYERLIAYGRPRMKHGEVLQWFASLKMKECSYYYTVSSHTKLLLYSESNVLLFPSRDEGLGLPIYTAHACNVDCVVSDIAPFAKVIRPEYRLRSQITIDSMVSITQKALDNESPLSTFRDDLETHMKDGILPSSVYSSLRGSA